MVNYFAAIVPVKREMEFYGACQMCMCSDSENMIFGWNKKRERETEQFHH